MCIEPKTVQNDTDKMCGVNVSLSFFIANEEGKLPSAAVGPSSKGKYFSFVGVHI